MRAVRTDDASPDIPSVRVPPAPLSSLTWRHRMVARIAGRATRGEPPRVLTTLARHRRMFRRWLPFATTLLLRPALPRSDVELIVLRTAWNCGSWYEWPQHVRLAGRAGLPADAVGRVPLGPAAPGWTKRQALLLRATDELHEQRVITDATWAELVEELDERQLVELPMLVGQYEMLAMTLNSLGVEPEPTALARLDGAAAAAADELRASLVRRRAGTAPR